MAELIDSGLRAEQDLVAELLNEALAELPEGLMQFVRSEVEEEQLLAGIVLASAAPENDTDEAISRRTALAAALELLQVALKITRLSERGRRSGRSGSGSGAAGRRAPDRGGDSRRLRDRRDAGH